MDGVIIVAAKNYLYYCYYLPFMLMQVVVLRERYVKHAPTG